MKLPPPRAALALALVAGVSAAAVFWAYRSSRSRRFRGRSLRDPASLRELEALLRSFPQPGVYQDEAPADWNEFIAHVFKAFESEEGLRGEAKLRIGKEIANVLQRGDESSRRLEAAIAALGCERSDGIDRLVTKLAALPRSLDGGKLYQEALSAKSRAEDLEKVAMDMAREGSEKRMEVLNGLRAKRPEDDALKKINEIVEQRCIQAEQAHKIAAHLWDSLERDPAYISYKAAKEPLSEFVKDWEDVNRRIGKLSYSSGAEFERLRTDDIVKEVCRRMKIATSSIKVLQNVFWNDKSGEVDLVLCSPDYSKAIALIEFKRNAFDIAAGYRQSASAVRKAEKEFLIWRNNEKKVKIQVGKECETFVVTSISKRRPYIGAETKLRGILEKYVRSEDPAEKTPEALRLKAVEFASGKKSPLQWLLDHGERNLIIL